jgi:cobalt-zinc-cadmium efflux system outer membrane protein
MSDKRDMSIRQFFFGVACAAIGVTGCPVLAQTTMSQAVANSAANGRFVAPSSLSAPLALAEVLEAARNNLDVRLAQQDVAATRADILAANRAPLPVLSAKAASGDQVGLTNGALTSQRRIDKSLGLDWTWERGGKRALRTQAAQSNAAASQADLAETLVQQQLVAKDAFFDLLAAQERLAHVQAMAQSATQLAATAQKRLNAGDLSVQDFSRVEIEAQRAQADAQSAQLDQQRAALALAQITGRQLRAEPVPQWRVQPQWPASGLTLAAGGSPDAWLESRADVQAATQRLAAAQAWLDSAQAQKKIDPTVGLSVDAAASASNRLVELRVQFPLQVGYAYEGEIGRAVAQQAQAQDMLDKVRLAAQGEWQGLQQDLTNAASRLQGYEALILPRARKVAEQAELAYTKGAIPLVDLLDARRTLRASLLEALTVQTEYAKAATAWQLRSRPASAVASTN